MSGDGRRVEGRRMRSAELLDGGRSLMPSCGRGLEVGAGNMDVVGGAAEV